MRPEAFVTFNTPIYRIYFRYGKNRIFGQCIFPGQNLETKGKRVGDDAGQPADSNADSDDFAGAVLFCQLVELTD